MNRRVFLKTVIGGSVFTPFFISTSCHLRRANKVFVFGLDGVPLSLLEKWGSKGKLPHIWRLINEGVSGHLKTTYPSISPSVWTSIATGLNPGKHQVYGFYFRQPDCYNIRVGAPGCIATNGGTFENIRKGLPIWQILSNKGYRIALINYPLSFPPEKVKGTFISGMGTPALSDGSHIYTTLKHDPAPSEDKTLIKSNPFETIIPGIEKIPLTIEYTPKKVTLSSFHIKPKVISIEKNNWSPWIEIKFTKVKGLARFKVLTLNSKDLRLYLDTIQIHPNTKKCPYISSYPLKLSQEIYKTIGPFITAGWKSDFLGFNKKKIDKTSFLEQIYQSTDERTSISQYIIKKYSPDFFMTVFTEPDRISHLFWKEMEEEQDKTIQEYYSYLDQKIGTLMKVISKEANIILLSDHGFMRGRYEVYMNAWLLKNGFMKLKEEAEKKTLLDNDKDVNWYLTQAFSYGFGKIQINKRDREPIGYVKEGEFERVRQTIIDRLKKEEFIDQVYPGEKLFKTKANINHLSIPYLCAKKTEVQNIKPDIFYTFKPGYKTKDIKGLVRKDTVIQEIETNWTGIHEGPFEPDLISGFIILHGPHFRSQEKLKEAEAIDFAPTVLEVMGISPLKEMDGKVLDKALK
jgi:predicted AlkP superfamily phosphohydrolase/phosphomutase